VQFMKLLNLLRQPYFEQQNNRKKMLV